ncbi:MAG: sigma-54-dependent Fis family transcriptional regulator, partial [Myxococcales bacterium]|nr:sigma-54-dependent Fis family transcriptional regulator [Myxococcales bacterium]
FVVFDCTQVGSTLVESELFGHARGAFTGAERDRRGVFEQAEGGTLFIDEVGDLALPLQAKLLRVVDRGEFRRVGAEQLQRVRVRVICATRRDLEREVQAGRFRDDLFHRLAVGRIELPPLRARAGDIPVLAKHLWAQGGGKGEVPAELVSRWSEEAWPGNVRELRNAIFRYIAVGDEEGLADDPPQPPRSGAKDFLDAVIEQGLTLAEARARVVREFEHRFLARTLEQHQGNVSRAASASGVARRHFQRLRAKSG